MLIIKSEMYRQLRTNWNGPFLVAEENKNFFTFCFVLGYGSSSLKFKYLSGDVFFWMNMEAKQLRLHKPARKAANNRLYRRTRKNQTQT